MVSLLDTQSAFSLLWGTVQPLELLRRAGELGYRRVAITDHANLYALPYILREGDDLPCRPIFGASFPLGAHKTVALMENAQGYANLCRIITRWHALHEEERSAPSAYLADNVAGLVFLSDARGVLAHVRARGGECYFRTGRSLSRPPRWVREERLPTVFAPEVCMADPAEHEAHRLLRAIALNKVLPEVAEEETAPPGAVLRPPADYAARFAVFAEAMRRSDALAERLAFTPTAETVFPPGPDGNAMEALRRKAYAGAEARYGELSESMAARMEYELGLIERKGFAEYFLVVEDIVKASPRTCGRGSGAASLVNYCLGVTNVDPIKYNLMFERFLNEGRRDPPDIDVDFAWDERDDVLDYAFATYGATKAAMVCNHLTFQPRMAIRETARAFGLTDTEITQTLRDRLPEFREAIGPVAVKHRDRPRRRNASRIRLPAPWPAILRLAGRLLGLPRLLSLHCGGMVIVPDEIAARVPVETAAKGYPMIQWEKDGTEEMGLVKIDLLGNRSLAVIRDTVRSVAQAEGIPEADVLPPYPADDPATCDLMARGATIGVFYVESPAMRLLQQKARRGDFEHLVIHSSIIRPAANGYINEYLARLHGKRWEPLHPRLAGVFDETYGVPVYQEDVCKLAMALAGFDATQADQLRKCLGKRDAARRLAPHRQAFYRGGRARGVEDGVLDAAWDSVLSMTGYSFCKPHSASYAQVSYQSAYLKAHYPAHFLAAVLSNGGGFYSTQAYVSEALRLGLRVYLPCVNRSAWAFTEDNGGIRVGFMAIQGLHRRSADAILAARADGPFRSLADCQQRTRLGFQELHRLAVIGALDSVAPTLNRPQILWMSKGMTKTDPARRGGAKAGPRAGDERGEASATGASLPSASTGPAAAPSPRSLFDSPAPQASLFAADAPPRQPPRLPPFTRRQRMETEYACLGFLVGAHPLALYDEQLRRLDIPVVSSRLLPQMRGRRVTLIGWPVTGKVVSTKHKEAMEFFSFEDAHGIYETVLFPKAYNRYGKLLQTVRPLLVTGTVQTEFGAVAVRVESVRPLSAPGGGAAGRAPPRRALTGGARGR